VALPPPLIFIQYINGLPSRRFTSILIRLGSKFIGVLIQIIVIALLDTSPTLC
jgi:hypothetical protein